LAIILDFFLIVFVDGVQQTDIDSSDSLNGITDIIQDLTVDTIEAKSSDDGSRVEIHATYFYPTIKHYVDAAVDLRMLYNEAPSYIVGSDTLGNDIVVTIDRESTYAAVDGTRSTYQNLYGSLSLQQLVTLGLLDPPPCPDTQYIGDINGNEIPFCLDTIDFPHNCAVDGCAQSKPCNTATGACDCFGYNYDCSVLQQSGEPDIAGACSSCDDVNTFACPVDGSSPCICNPGFYGDTCETNRVTAVCGNTNLEVTIFPYGDFGGSIFALNTGNNDAKVTTCTFSDDGNGVYTKTYPYDEADGTCAAVNSEEVDSVTTYTFKFYIQYDTTFYTSNDGLIEVICKKLPDGTVQTVTSNIGSINDILPDANSVASDIDSGIVAALFLTATGVAVSGAVDVGTSIQLHYTLTRGVTPDFSLKGVTSYNFEPTVSNLDTAPTDGTPWTIIEEWCILNTASVFTISLSKTSDQNEVRIFYEFTAYIYVANPTDFEGIWFSSVLCLGACQKNGQQEAACVPADHVTGGDNIDDTLEPAVSLSGKRKRREVGQTEEILVNQKLEVVERRDTQTGGKQGELGEELCLSVLTFALPIATLGMLLVISCCVVLYFWVKMYRSRGVETNKMTTSKAC